MGLRIKICGITRVSALDAALEAGVDMVGFVFFAPSPRHLGLNDLARLGTLVADRAEKVALSVDADDATMAAIVDALRPDWLQLHGGETPQRIEELRRRFGLKIMKAIGVRERRDLAAIADYRDTADRLLFDARPPRGASRPGGLGRPFDWDLLADLPAGFDFMLSGGLDAGNVAAALAATRAPGLDISSGVETAPGRKDPRLIAEFVETARAAARGRQPQQERISP